MTNWKSIVYETTGIDPNTELVPPYVGILMFFVINAITASSFRKFASYLLWPGIAKIVIDIWLTIEHVSYMLENNLVLKNYGHLWYAAMIVPQLFWMSWTSQGGSTNCLGEVKAALQGCKTWRQAGVQILAQLAGGFLAIRVCMFIWSLELTPGHSESYQQYAGGCGTNLAVIVPLGFLIELMGSATENWLALQTVSPHWLADNFVKNSWTGIICSYGTLKTGMFTNPAMAVGNEWMCTGTPPMTHLFIYWLGPLLGLLFAMEVDRCIFHIDSDDTDCD